MAKPTVQLTIRVPEELYLALRKLAQDKNICLNQAAKDALAQYAEEGTNCIKQPLNTKQST